MGLGGKTEPRFVHIRVYIGGDEKDAVRMRTPAYCQNVPRWSRYYVPACVSHATINYSCHFRVREDSSTFFRRFKRVTLLEPSRVQLLRTSRPYNLLAFSPVE